MGAPLHLQVAVNRHGLRQAAGALRGWLATSSINSGAAYGAELALEEIGSNLLRHSSPQAPATWLRLEAEQRGTELELRLLDNGPPFDPTRAAAPNLELPISERPIGGLGLLLVRRMAADWCYTRTPEGNRLVCRFNAADGAAPPR
jgi:anti-sigma regulatory factor (Ser/Thr protein kinase)